MERNSLDSSTVDELKAAIKKLEAKNSFLQEQLSRRSADLIDVNEQSLRILLSNLDGIVYRYIPIANDLSDWQTDFISKGADKLTGYSPEELVTGKKKVSDFIKSPVFARKILGEIKLALSNKKGFHLKYPITTKDGTVKWLSDHGAGVFDDDGRLISLEGVITDITKERQRELHYRKAQEEISHQNKLIQERERAYSNLIRNMQGMAYRSSYTDGSLTPVFISEGCLQLTGYTPAELMSEPQFFEKKIVVEEYRQQVWQTILKAIEQQKAFEVTYPIITREGKYKWAYERGLGVLNDDDELVAVEGVIVDITESKEHEKQYRLAKVTIDNAPIIIEWIKEDGSFHYVNERAVEVAGWTKEEFYEKKLFDIDPLVTPKVWKEIFTERNEQDIKDFESMYPKKDGTSFPCLVSAANIEFEGTTYNCSYISDISELKATQNQLKRAVDELTATEEEMRLQSEELTTLNDNLGIQKAELEEAIFKLKNTKDQLVQAEKMASLGVFVAGIAHELNNPINYISTSVEALEIVMEDIKGFFSVYAKLNKDNVAETLRQVEILNEDIPFEKLVEEFSKMMVNISEGAKNASEIVRGLRTFSRLDKEKTEIHNIHDNINNVLLMLRNSYKYNIKVEKKFGVIPPVECAPGQINQVLLNLIGNAIQSIAGKGTVTISTRLRGDHILIEIKDTGKGMSDEVKKRIFEPFYTTKGLGQGTGLGLSISLGIIQDHNGSINVESDSRGSVFTISLPVKQPRDGD